MELRDIDMGSQGPSHGLRRHIRMSDTPDRTAGGDETAKLENGRRRARRQREEECISSFLSLVACLCVFRVLVVLATGAQRPSPGLHTNGRKASKHVKTIRDTCLCPSCFNCFTLFIYPPHSIPAHSVAQGGTQHIII